VNLEAEVWILCMGWARLCFGRLEARIHSFIAFWPRSWSNSSYRYTHTVKVQQSLCSSDEYLPWASVGSLEVCQNSKGILAKTRPRNEIKSTKSDRRCEGVFGLLGQKAELEECGGVGGSCDSSPRPDGIDSPRSPGWPAESAGDYIP